MSTLLEKAKLSKSTGKTPTKINEQTVELALAWARGEITTAQVQRALEGKKQPYATLALSLKEYITKAKI